jgi:hypothetical protein
MCGEYGQSEQALPSQQAIHKYVMVPHMESLSNMDINPLEVKDFLDEFLASQRMD